MPYILKVLNLIPGLNILTNGQITIGLALYNNIVRIKTNNYMNMLFLNNLVGHCNDPTKISTTEDRIVGRVV